jgi:hypothetical protein
MDFIRVLTLLTCEVVELKTNKALVTVLFKMPPKIYPVDPSLLVMHFASLGSICMFLDINDDIA